VPAALAAYARARTERATLVQQASRKNGEAYHLGRPWSFARDFAMRRMGPDGMRKRHAWIYDWRAPS
jgi:salicylate hydroxylase